jgi:RNA polymerase sigma factor (TIGR02999 family)
MTARTSTYPLHRAVGDRVLALQSTKTTAIIEGMREARAEASVTAILARLRDGNEHAHADLFTAIYAEIRAIAEAQVQGPAAGHSLSPSALINELYIKLTNSEKPNWSDRKHFLSVAAVAMRQIVIDHVRRRRAMKRDPARVATGAFDALCDDLARRSFDLLAVHEALGRLESFDATLARLVDLHFFAGLPLGECGAIMGLSPRTVTRYWNTARDWLRQELGK